MDPRFTWGVFSEALISCQQRFVGVVLTDLCNIASHFEQPMSSIEWVIIKLGVTLSSLWAPLSLTQTNSERLNEQLRATLNNPSEPPRESVRDILERRPQPDELEAAYRAHDGLKPTNKNYANELAVILNYPWLIIKCN